MKIESLKIDTLLPYAKNSRTHSEEQINQIADSIKEFGFTNPILIDGENEIIAGHGRVLAAKRMQMEEVCASTIRAEKPKRSAEHPTMKPVGLILGMLKNSTRRGGGNPRLIRRFRFNAYRLRKIRPSRSAYGARPRLLRCDRQEMAGFHGEAGNSRIREVL